MIDPTSLAAIRYISRTYPIREILSQFGINVDAKMIVCPFHYDENPSAKFYDDDDGVNRLYCHGCKKQYTSYDYLRLKHTDYLTKLLSNLEVEVVRNTAPITTDMLEDTEVQSTKTVSSAESIQTIGSQFRRGQIDINQYLTQIFNLS